MIRADRVPPKERSVQNAAMRCEDEASASYVRVDCSIHLHGTLLHLPVSSPSLSPPSHHFAHTAVICDSCTSTFVETEHPPSSSEDIFESHMFRVHRCWNYYVSRWGLWVPILQGVITFFVVINFSLATFMDPGVIPKGKHETSELYITYCKAYVFIL